MADTSKLNLRLPAHLRARLERQAAQTGVSLNALCLLALDNYLTFRERMPPKARLARREEQSISELAAELGEAPAPAPMGRVVHLRASTVPCPCGSEIPFQQCHGRSQV